MFNIDEIDQTIVKYVLLHKKVHYHELMQATGLSRKTVANHLDKLETELQSVDVKLIRKRGDGVYFTGNTDQLLVNLQIADTSKINRTDQLLQLLLLSQCPITIQEMADSLFVSRNTLQLNIKQARHILEANQLQLQTTVKGLQIIGPEKRKRHVLSELLNVFWQISGKEVQGAPISIGHVEKLFKQDYLIELTVLIRNFLNNQTIGYTDYQIKNFVIHVAILINRVKVGHTLDANSRRIEHEQLDETTALIHKLETTYEVKLPATEWEYVNLHLMTLKNSTKNDNESFHQINDFLMTALGGTDYDEVLVRDLSLHLMATIDRLKAGLSIKNPYIGEVKRNFPYNFDRAVQLMETVQEQYHVVVPEDEVAYVALHFQSYLDRQLAQAKVDTIILCTTGLGMARFLEQRVYQVYGDKLNVVQVISRSKFEKSSIEVPLVLSTVAVADTYQAVVVSPLLEEIDQVRINRALEKIVASQDQSKVFTNLINRNRIYVRDDITNKRDAITFLGTKLEQQGFAKPGVVQSALERERISSTRMRSIGFPHAKVDFIKVPSISILLNPKGIDWNGKTVYLIFFIGLNDSVMGQVRKIYKYFSQLIQPDFTKLVMKSRNSTEVYNLIIQYLRK